MAYGYRIGTLPITTVQRLPSYLRVVREFHRNGREVVSSAHLAEALRLEAILVRKDFGYLGITGKPRSGYRIAELIAAMELCLNWHHVSQAVLVGAGHLGTALLGYEGFAHHGINLAAAFDVDPARIGVSAKGVTVQPLDCLEASIAETGARLAILTTSPEAAQQVAERLVRAGIEGIWNFAGATLRLPPHVIVQDQDIAAGLAVLSAKLNARGPQAAAADTP